MGGSSGQRRAAEIQARAMERAAELSSEATRYAADLQSQATTQSLELQERMYNQESARQQQFYDTQRADTADQRALGSQSFQQLQEMLAPGGELRDKFTGEDLENEAGYRFRQEQGTRGLEASQAARGGLLSGAAAKEAMAFNQGLASEEYANAYNRHAADQDRTFNYLTTAGNLGAAAVGAGAQNVQAMTQLSQANSANVSNTVMGNAASLGGLYTQNAANQANIQMQGANVQAQLAMMPSRRQQMIMGGVQGAQMGMAFGPMGAIGGAALGALFGGM